MPTPSQEDYLEAIWQLIQEKGYARVSDIAERLGISRASVSRMIRKLHTTGQLTVERYRGLNLTSQGLRRGQHLFERHQVLESLLGAMGFTDAARIRQTVEGIEHFFGNEEMRRVERFLRFLDDHPEIMAIWTAYQREHPMGDEEP